MICETCGKEMAVGDWPFCPHGKPSWAAHDDVIEGGPRWFENLGHEPVWIETKSQLRAELAARHLEPMVRWAGPHDQHLTRWDAVDPQTLKNAQELVSRM